MIGAELDLPVTVHGATGCGGGRAEGARAAWPGEATGSLAPGRSAGVLLLDTQGFGWLPLNDPGRRLIGSGHPGLVDTVFVAGGIVTRHGRLVDFELRRVRRPAGEARDRVLGRCGLAEHIQTRCLDGHVLTPLAETVGWD